MAMNPPHSAGLGRLAGTIALASAALGICSTSVAGTVTGTVKDSVTNAVVSGVKAMVTQQTSRYANTNTSGVYSITSVTAGTVTLTASKTGYITQVTGDVVVPDSGAVTAPLILLVKAGTITGTVVNASGGAAVSGATVKVTGTTTSTTTNSSGVFTLYQATGSYTLTVSLTGWVTATTGSFSVTNNQTTNVGAIPLTQTATVTGTVKESGTGTVLASVSVKLHSDTSKTATTNSSGVFTLTGIPVGTQSLDLSKSGYVSQTTASFSVVAGTNNVGDLLLVKSTGSITGIIQDAQTGNAGLAGATVTVNSVTPTISATTAGDGSYTLAGVPVGTRTVNASMTGYTARNTASITVTQGQTVSAGSLALTRTTVSVTGTVTDSATAAPISSATVSVQEQSGKTATTNSSGAYTLSGVYWGSIHLAAAKTNYTTKTVPLTLTAGSNATQNIALDPITGAISGTVTDTQAGGAGLAGATVIVNSVTPVISTTTAANGTYTLTGVPVGTRTINASAANYVAANSGNVTVTANQTTTGINRSLNRTTVSVSGTVRDGTTSATIAGATVRVQEQSSKSTGTDGSGYYSLTGVYWGDVHLQVSADSYTAKTIPVSLTAGTNPTQDVTLDSAFGRITGTVLDASTQLGLPDVNVVLTDDTGIGSGVDGFGHFTLENVPIGSHSLTVSRDRYATVTTDPIVVNPGTTTAPVIAMTPDRCSISGVVRDGSTGGGFAGATVTAARDGQTATTDEWGAFTLSGLAPGAELLAVTADGYAPITTDVFVLNAGDTPTDWVLDVYPPGDRTLGTVHGTVHDASGSPLAGATVGLVGGASTTSAADGTYSITAHGGRYALVASKAGFRTIFTPNHGNGPADSDRPWQIQQDFILPGATDTATLEITAHDPVLLTPRESDFMVYTPTAAYRIVVPSSGTRTVGNIPAGPLYGRAFPVLLGAGTTVPLDIDGPLTLPGTSPNWAAFGTVVRDTTKAPVPGVAVTLTNEGASFATTATTDANGRWSFTNGPLGDYSVTYAGPGGLTRPEPWRFTATEDGWWGETTTLVAPGDTGTITCTAPESGATLTADISRVDCTASLPRPGDYIRVAWISLSNGQIQSQTTSYDLDGRGLHFDVVSSSHNGPQHIDVTAGPRLDDWLSVAIPVVMQKVAVPAQVVLDPVEVPGGTQVNGTVILNVAAPAGGLDVSLSSSNTGVATVPATVNVTEGSDRGWFTVTTLPQAASTSVSISASANGGASSATLSVSPSTFGSITGQVVDAVTGVGLSEVTVLLADNPSIGTGVDWEGRFTFANVPVGSHTLTASRNGYADAATAEIIVTPAGVAQPPTINLAPNPVTIQGQLVPVGSGLGLPGATITAARSGQSTVTDGSGNFTLSGLAPGYELLTATREGFAPSATNEISLYPGQTVNVGMDIFDGSRPNGVVHGTVRDSAGAPVSDATVAIVGGPSVQTQTDGSYTMTLPGGRYVLRATKDGYRTQVSRNHGDAPLWQTNWQVQQDFVLYTPAETGVVELTTADAFTGTPNQGRVWLQGLYEAYWADTSPQGQRTLPAVPAGKLFGWAAPRSLTPGGVLELAFYAGATLPDTPPRWGAYGMAYRATTGEPAPDATVELTNASASFATTVTTDSRGRWSFTGGPLGAYGVTASAGGGLTSDNRFDFTPEDNGDIYGWDPIMSATTDAGALVVDDPAPGAVLLGGLTSVSCTGTLPRQGDYLTSAWVTLSQGQVQSQNVAYDIDGRRFRIDVTAEVANGPLTVTVGARTWYGKELAASTSVMVGIPSAPLAVSMNPASVVGGATSTGMITLGSPAGAGGVSVALTSSAPAAATVPPTVVVPQGAWSTQFIVTTSLVATETPVTVSATTADASATSTLTVQPLVVTSVSFNPAVVLPGSSSVGTVTLNGVAPAGGFTVGLTNSRPGAASVPVAIVVTEGNTEAHFSVTTVSSVGPTLCQITATTGEASVSAALAVGAGTFVTSVTVDPSSLLGGESGVVTVGLSQSAPSGGLQVTLSSSDPVALTMPASLTIPGGAVSGQVSVKATNSNGSTSVIITATGGGATTSATLSITPVTITRFDWSLGPITGDGRSVTYTITLSASAPTTGLYVNFTCDHPAIVPLTLTWLSPGRQSATFMTSVGPVSSETVVTICASAGGSTKCVTFLLQPMGLSGVAIGGSVLGGDIMSGSVVLNSPAPAGGTTVSLTTSAPSVTALPAAVTVPEGATVASFNVTTLNPDAPTPVVITASANGLTVTGTFTIIPITVTAISVLGGDDVGSGAVLNIWFYINFQVPPSALMPQITLTSDNPAVLPLPAVTTVYSYWQSCIVITHAGYVSVPTPVTITASCGGATVSTIVTVEPLMVQKIQLEDPALENGELRANNQVRLNGTAPAGGATVTLTSASPQVSVPPTITIAAGACCVSFQLVNALPVCTDTPVTISASLGSQTATVDLIGTPTKANRVLLDTNTVVGGQSTTASFRFRGWLNPLDCAEVISTSDPSVAWFNQSQIGRPTSLACSYNASTYEQVCPVQVWTSRVPTTTPVTISITSGGVTKTATLTVQSADVTGVAPGWVLPGQEAVAYGHDFQVGTSVELLGPVYDLATFANPKCSIGGGSCAVTSLVATPSASGDALSFAVPASFAPGVYAIRTRTQAGSASNVTLWLAVDQAPITVPALTAEQHKYARAIHSGQTVTGTFVANGDTSGISADYNYFYFFATAGSTIDAALERVDTSKPWEHPDSLDPEIEIAVPDGFVPQNLVALDNRPGVDLNASLHGAVLPLTGTYVLRAATSRGFGDYRLHFAVTSMAPASEGARIIPFMDAFATVPVNGTTTPTAIVLDPRGYQLSGAQVTITTAPQPGDRGQIEFSPAALTSGPDGSIQTTATARATGKVTFAPAFVDTFTSSVMSMTGVAVSAQTPRHIPRYQSVARQPFAVTGLYEGDCVGLSTGAFERLPIERHASRREVRSSGRESQRTGLSAGTSKQGSAAAGTATRAPDRGSLAMDHDLEPLDASTAVPLREIEPHGMTATAQAITSCGHTTFTQGIVPAGTVLHPPFTATLTDLTPPTGGTDPNGLVGIDGIHGHRIEKNARLKLEITDALGAEPTYPVLVQLAMGGPRHGQVILDPDGTRIACNVAAFIWHDRDDQGNLIAANEQFEIGMGTLSSYVGVAPDPVTPGQVVPVWGTAELLNLSAQAKVQIDGAWADPFLMAYGVHPEPGKPDHFLCTDRQGQACPDVFEYWTGYQLDVTSQPLSSLPMVLLNAYVLGDRYGNLVYGPTATSASAPGLGVTVGFADQTSGTTSGDPAGYALTTTWPMRPAPSGQLTSTVSATYPDDPAGDWGGGTVNKEITYQFDTGSTHLLLQAQSYEKRLADQGLAVVDGPLPIAVAPGATGSLATLADGSTPRLVLLALSGSDVTSLVTGWGQEPSSVPGWGWNTGGGCAEPWCWVQWNPPWDLVVETQATASFRLALEDGTGRVASEGSFVVHTCPRAEHETDGPPPAQGCTDLAIPSTNGTVDVTLNQAGSARGYLGIELTTAPVAPGTYVVWVESLDQAYRVRETAQLVGRGPADEYRGGYAICTVMGEEILDENFQRIEQIQIVQPRTIYVRYVDPTRLLDDILADVRTEDSSGTTVSTLPAVALTRVAGSGVFLSSPISLGPPPNETWSQQAGRRSGTAAVHRVASFGAGSLVAASGRGAVVAQPNAKPPLRATTWSGFIHDFRIGQLTDWTEPNLLFGNGTDYVDMSVRISFADGSPVPTGTVVGITPGDSLGSVSNVSTADAEGRVSFRYTAPLLPMGSDGFVRPAFWFSYQLPGQQAFAGWGGHGALEPGFGSCHLPGDNPTDPEYNRHCYGDPNFPIVYARYDFRRAIWFHSDQNHTPAPLTDDKYVACGDMSEADIQSFLHPPGAPTWSRLGDVYFVAQQAELDTTNFTDPTTGVGTAFGSDPARWPPVYLDLNGNGTFEAAADMFGESPESQVHQPSDGYRGVPFAHVLWFWCNAKGVNPRVILTHLQAEGTLLRGSAAFDPDYVFSLLDTLMNYATWDPLYQWPSVQIARGTQVAVDRYLEAHEATPDVPHSDTTHLFRPMQYYATPPCKLQDANYRFGLGPGTSVPTGLYYQTRVSYALFLYTNAVNQTGCGGGNELFMQLWAQYGFDH
jgi:hypothetical protein